MKIGPAAVMIAVMAVAAYADDGQQRNKPQQEVNLDMVSDTVGQVFNKANAILSGNLEVTMAKKVDKRDDYTINAMGQRVPKATAVNTGGALHNDEPL